MTTLPLPDGSRTRLSRWRVRVILAAAIVLAMMLTAQSSWADGPLPPLPRRDPLISNYQRLISNPGAPSPMGMSPSYNAGPDSITCDKTNQTFSKWDYQTLYADQRDTCTFTMTELRIQMYLKVYDPNQEAYVTEYINTPRDCTSCVTIADSLYKSGLSAGDYQIEIDVVEYPPAGYFPTSGYFVYEQNFTLP